MKLIIDTNVIISALIKKGFTRDFIFKKADSFEFITPAYIFGEINKYKQYIIEKSNINEKELYLLLDALFEYIKIINPIFYSDYLTKAKRLISHINDVPFLACAIALKIPIWSDDKHLQEQKIIKVLTTKDIIHSKF